MGSICYWSLGVTRQISTAVLLTLKRPPKLPSPGPIVNGNEFRGSAAVLTKKLERLAEDRGRGESTSTIERH